VRQLYAEAGSAAGIVLGRDPSAVRIDDRAADREPHAEPFRLGGEEWFEEPGEVLLGDPCRYRGPLAPRVRRGWRSTPSPCGP
jgi:hypothetical protein